MLKPGQVLVVDAATSLRVVTKYEYESIKAMYDDSSTEGLGLNVVTTALYNDWKHDTAISSFNLSGNGLIPEIKNLSFMPQGILNTLDQGFAGLGIGGAGVTSILPSSGLVQPSLGYSLDSSATGLSAALDDYWSGTNDGSGLSSWDSASLGRTAMDNMFLGGSMSAETYVDLALVQDGVDPFYTRNSTAYNFNSYVDNYFNEIYRSALSIGSSSTLVSPSQYSNVYYVSPGDYNPSGDSGSGTGTGGGGGTGDPGSGGDPGYDPGYDPGGGDMDMGEPVGIDLANNGLQLVSMDKSTAFFDMDDDGYRERTGWVGPDDGLLVIDLDGDGVIDKAKEISFKLWSPDATSDLDGLRLAFDSNNDGVFNAQDARFSEFRIWQDQNQNGISEAGELTTLAERGLVANLLMAA